MDRVCPFLGLASDHRTAVGAFDPDHRCGRTPSAPLDRLTQLQLCLQGGYAECDRFKEGQALRAERAARRRPAPDATFVSTRLVLEAEPAWRGVALTAGRAGQSRGLVLTGASVIVLLAAAAAAASTHGFGLLSASVASPTPSPAIASPTPTPTASPTPAPTATPTPALTPAPTQTPSAPTQAPRPTPRTYVVQSGDTLSSIAARFGTTVRAIAAANGIDPIAVLNIGQVLIIP